MLFLFVLLKNNTLLIVAKSNHIPKNTLVVLENEYISFMQNLVVL